MIKKYNEIQVGDVFECEYGDYGNIVKIVFESQEIEYRDGIPTWLKTVGYYRDGSEFECYAPIYNGAIPTYYVIEEAE